MAAIHAQPQFEVATFKPAASHNSPDVNRRTPIGYSATMPLEAYIRFAYQLRPNQISGPGWIVTERYDLEAKAEKPSTPDEMRIMLQHLLEERLHIKLHREIREQSGYVLVVDKGKPKIHATSDRLQQPAITPAMPSGTQNCTNVTMPYFASYLSRQVDETVVDSTGLAGAYDFSILWTSGPMLVRFGGGVERMATVENDGPTIFDALREVGLKLVASKVPVEHLVIDHIEKTPIEN
jgi:uncharacterized protein (TIGR03435 family)